MTIYTETIPTPAGALRIAVRAGTTGAPGRGEAEAVVALAFHDHFDRVYDAARVAAGESIQTGPTASSAAVAAYVAGDLRALDDIAVAVTGTAFQQRVWSALRTIPVGATWSYGELADAIGSPRAVRAVGSANGANPVWLILPCHRVIRSDGALGGYGGGLHRKEWLLSHEGAVAGTAWSE